MVSLIGSTWALAATCCASDAGILDLLARPRTVAEVHGHARHLPAPLVDALLDVLETSGAVTRDDQVVRISESAAPLVRSPFRAAMRAEMKATLLQARCLLSAGRPAAGDFIPWRHADPEVLETQGAGGSLLAELISTSVVPAAPGLRARIAAPDASFLDVGAGVARLSIAMAERWPALRVVGLEPWGASGQLACRHVRSAGLEHRITIRRQRVEALTDRDAFDLAWLPAPFIAEAVLPEALTRLCGSLRHGGWIVVGITGVGEDTDAADAALTRLITATWGGSAMDAERGRALLAGAGFRDPALVTDADGPTLVIAQRQ